MSQLNNNLVNMEKGHSLFENFIRTLPVPILKEFVKGSSLQAVEFKKSNQVLTTNDLNAIETAFPLSIEKSENKILVTNGVLNIKNKRVAVLFSGGPASGGHNVIVGIKKALGEHNTLLATKAGPKGLLAGEFFEITEAMVASICNTGGFDFMGSDRTKIKSDEQFAQVKKIVAEYKIDAIIIVGGDDSNTNAAILAELLIPLGVAVIGVPKTIDGDLQLGDLLPISFGFDTATKIYAEMVGNILQDTASSLKYWHFVKIMGRAASHVALETALQTRPAYTIISEEILEKKMSLAQVIEDITNTIKIRVNQGINHGLVLIPEGFIEFIPEMRILLNEMDEIMGHNLDIISTMDINAKKEFIVSKLSAGTRVLYQDLPSSIQDMLLLERDSHGNLPLSQIPTEILVIEMVATCITKLQLSSSKDSLFTTYKFNALNHFFGYEGRCGAPTLFDAAYCLNLGLIAGSLVLGGHTGYIAAITDLQNGGVAQAIPLTGLLNIERRHGQDEFVIEKALVKLDSPAFEFFVSRRKQWAENECFTSPGPRQLMGSVAKTLPITVALNRKYENLTFNLGADTEIK
ncbi:MAG: diphosphate--fructose-6-phosphate 1-phosphotransferase [Spirochaetota bacterium]|nr:diphosphate--fructose-6-phosphate 1-phosphotransferase [Spirochaetota bacterium]